MRILLSSLMAALLLASVTDAQYGDISDLKIAKPADKEDVKPTEAPKGAIILLDGKNLDGWVYRKDGKSPSKWEIKPEGVQVKGGDMHTKEKFGGKFKLHLEFRVPYEPKNKGQARGNSGVYVQGRYEVQILDSYGLKPGMGDCGAIYGIAIPKENACKAPTIWQSYDIEFTAPTMLDGKRVNGRMTVVHNGVKIHDNVELTKDNTTAGMGGDVFTPGPILLQDHGHPVQYRNIWLLPVKE